MNEVTELPLDPCPECNGDTRLTATVHAGQWERLFLHCRACDQTFAGPWRSTHEPRSAVAPQQAA